MFILIAANMVLVFFSFLFLYFFEGVLMPRGSSAYIRGVYGVTSNLFQFQTTDDMISSSSDPPQVFPICLWHSSMHCWKDASWKPLISIVTALMIASKASKYIHIMIFLSQGKEKVTRCQTRWIGRLSQFSDIPLDYELLDA